MASKSSPAARDAELRGSFSRPRRGRAARRTGLPGLSAAAVTLSGLLTACGGAGAGAAAAGHQAPASPGSMISARTLPGVGTVLVDRSGKTIYSPQQEAHGRIMCTGGCLSFWFPVSVAPAAAVRAPGGITGVIGKIHRRDDGLTQLTYNGKPLYTFRLDQAPGQAHGNNFTDHFGSASFTWHAMTAAGAQAGPATPGGSAGGY